MNAIHHWNESADRLRRDATRETGSRLPAIVRRAKKARSCAAGGDIFATLVAFATMAIFGFCAVVALAY